MPETALGASIQHTKPQNALTPTTTKHLVLILIFTNLKLKHNFTKLGREHAQSMCLRTRETKKKKPNGIFLPLK